MRYELKKYQLTLDEYYSFIYSIINGCILKDGTVDYASLEVQKKLQFVDTYFEHECGDDVHKLYAIACNIDFEDYKEDISYIQLMDAFESIDNILEKLEKQSSTFEQFFALLNNRMDNLLKPFENINVEDFVENINKLNEITQMAVTKEKKKMS